MKKDKILWLFLIPLIVPLAVWRMQREKPCSAQLDTSIGVPSSYSEGWKLSLLQLSREMKRCPKARRFVIRRKTRWFRGDELKTTYDKNTRTLFDDRYGEGSPYRWVKVEDEMIHEVAAAGGSFDDFKKYGCIDDAP